MFVLAIDVGTTRIKALVFSKEGKILASSYREIATIYPKPQWMEQDPIDIWNAVREVVRDVVKDVGVDNILSIGITNQRETVILWDKKTGEPVYNAILWQDLRTKDDCRKLSNYEELIKEKTGLTLHPYFSASKIKWVIDNVSGVKEGIREGRIIFGTVDSWVLWNLTGREVHSTEPSNASRTLCFNIKKLNYDPELLGIFGIPENILPEVKDSATLFGYTHRKLFGKEIPITGILGDQQASLFAHGGWEEDVVKCTYGTGLFVLLSTGNKVFIPKKLLSTIAWKVGEEITYALEGSVLTGGSSVKWLRDNLRIIESAAETEFLAKSLSSNEGVYFIPAFSGLGAPYWDTKVRGTIIGITARTGRAHLARAVLEAIAYQVKDVVEEMEKETGKKVKVLRVDGGATQNNFLMQFQSDILGINVERPQFVEITSLGAAGISGIYSGLWNSREEFIEKVGSVESIFKPKMNRADAERLYIGWKNAVRKAIKWYREEC